MALSTFIMLLVIHAYVDIVDAVKQVQLVIPAVKTHCLLRAAVSLMQDEDKGSEGGR